MSAKPGVAQASHKRKHVASDPFWRERANCRASNSDAFFDPTRYAEAQLICLGCPVKAECLAERHGASGVWGGRVFLQKGEEQVATPPNVPLTEQDWDTAEQMLRDGCSYYEIARTLGRSETPFRRHFPGRGWTKTEAGQYGAFVHRMQRKVAL